MAPLKTAYSRRPAMCTFFEIFLAGDDSEHLDAVAAAVLDEVGRLERLLSRLGAMLSRLPSGSRKRPNDRESMRPPVGHAFAATAQGI